MDGNFGWEQFYDYAVVLSTGAECFLRRVEIELYSCQELQRLAEDVGFLHRVI